MKRRFLLKASGLAGLFGIAVSEVGERSAWAYGNAGCEEGVCNVGEQDASAVARGREFLVDLQLPDLDLLPEFRGHNVFCLYHDNYLAAKVLEKTHADVATRISAAIRKHGVTQSGKIEMLFGESALPLRHYELRDVAKVNGYQIRSEFTTDRIRSQEDIEGYADLLLFCAIADSDIERARHAWKSALKSWDGVGFHDRATAHSSLFATYKLSLALIAAGRDGLATPEDNEILASCRQRLRSAQAESGGWITDYRPDGSLVGQANVETTCLSIMGLCRVPS
ncbi:MAG: hypothetical protein WCI02_11920 [Planctomycetota bacterium]